MTLLYHQTLLEILDLPTEVDNDQVALMERWEQQTGFTLPEALRQWYGMHHRGFPVRWDEPATALSLVHLLEGTWGSMEWHDSRPFLTVLWENQGVYHLLIPLDAGDDPPIYYRLNEAGEPLRWHCPSYSAWLLMWVLNGLEYFFLENVTWGLGVAECQVFPVNQLESMLDSLQQKHPLLSETHHALTPFQELSTWLFIGHELWVQVQKFQDDSTFTVVQGEVNRWKVHLRAGLAAGRLHNFDDVRRF